MTMMVDMGYEPCLGLFERLIAFLRDSRFEDIARIPLRKYKASKSLWLNEISNIAKYICKKNNLFSVSLFPDAYIGFRPENRSGRLRRLFFENQSMPEHVLTGLLPPDWFTHARDIGLFKHEPSDLWRFMYRIVPYEDRYFVTTRFQRETNHFTYLSFDSLYLAAFISQRLAELDLTGKRALDLGTGSGILACEISDRFDDIIGTDLSAPAIEMARLNAALNGLDHCTFKQTSLYEGISGEFDLIVSNPPFIHWDDQDAGPLDSDGGHPFGLGITFAVLNDLPDYLSAGGRAIILTRSPCLNSKDYLYGRLADYLPADFGWHYSRVSDSFEPLKDSEKEVGIQKYFNVIIEIFKGSRRNYAVRPLWHRRTNLF
jgi:hypothetical protein